MVDGKENIKFDLGVKELSGGMIDFWYLKWQKQDTSSFFLRTYVPKKKYKSLKKLHWSGGVIDLWYLKWQKQEKHIELFHIPQ